MYTDRSSCFPFLMGKHVLICIHSDFKISIVGFMNIKRLTIIQIPIQSTLYMSESEFIKTTDISK